LLALLSRLASAVKLPLGKLHCVATLLPGSEISVALFVSLASLCQLQLTSRELALGLFELPATVDQGCIQNRNTVGH